MKTGKLNSKVNIQPQVKERQQEQATKTAIKEKQDQSYVLKKTSQQKKDDEDKNLKIEQFESVTNHIQDSIQWKKMKLSNPGMIVMVFSMPDGHIYSRYAISAGASAYVSKCEEPENIINAIRRVQSQIPSRRRGRWPRPRRGSRARFHSDGDHRRYRGVRWRSRIPQ